MSREKPPVIHSRTISAKSRFFTVESIQLEFANGEQRLYERLLGSGRNAVMMLPLTDRQSLLLTYEYAAGTDSYELGFPKGLMDPGETAEQSANRELQEEIGLKAAQFHHLKDLRAVPSYLGGLMHVYIASGLTENSLLGDEPEPLEVVEVPITELDQLLSNPNFSEARSVAAVLLFQQWWSNQGKV